MILNKQISRLVETLAILALNVVAAGNLAAFPLGDYTSRLFLL